MNLNRRQFLRSLGALATAAVVIGTTGQILPLPADARALLLSQAKTGGIIRDQFFEFYGPVTIEGITDLWIEGCTFIFHGLEAKESALTLSRCERFLISNCHFDIRDSHADVIGFHTVEPAKAKAIACNLSNVTAIA